jgi:hypothetical protein
VNNTGWQLPVPDDLIQTPEPSAAELNSIREYDKQGFWTS